MRLKDIGTRSWFSSFASDKVINGGNDFKATL